MESHGPIMVAQHDPGLVVLSVAVSILAAYAARDLTGRIADARGRAWPLWLAVGATVDAVGTWSMHYTGKLALRLPVPVLFDWPMVLLSFLVGVAGSAAALSVHTRRKIGRLRAVATSFFLGGIGISGLHYTAMGAMRTPGMHHSYSVAPVVLSVVLAIALALVAASLSFLIGEDTPHRWLRYHASALVRGSANPVMHYTAMAAVTFAYTGETEDLSHAVNASSLGIIGVSVVPVTVLVVTLLTSLVDRLQKQRSLLHELFEQSPHPVTLMSLDGRIARVNREFVRVFGYGQKEAVGRRLDELIVPDEAREEFERYLDLTARGQRFDADGVRRRKDGSRLYVSITGVPVSLPGGEVAVYAIYRDITERREAAEARERLRDRLATAEEEERRRIARELHDQMGGDLTALSLLLKSLEAGVAPQSPAHEQALKAQAAVESLDEDLHYVVWELRPPALDRSPLDVALEEYLEGWSQYHGLEHRFESKGFEGRRLPPPVETAVYRIVQEALNNVKKHASARSVSVELALEREPRRLRVVVTDDGVGFNVDEESVSSRKFGLTGIRERVELLDGECHVRSAPGAGTTVTVIIPV
jgi:PAS domain S-box-containing protein